AVRSALDDGGGRQVGGDVRTDPGNSNDRPCEERQREDKHHCAEPACREVGRQEWRGHEPVERKPGNNGKPPCKRRPNNDLSGICGVVHGRAPNPKVLVYVTSQTAVKLLPKLAPDWRPSRSPSPRRASA